MHVVAHQHRGVQSAAETPECMMQALQVALAIQVIQEARQPVVPARHYVLGNTGKVETRKSNHA